MESQITFELSGAREMVEEDRALALVSEIEIDYLACTSIKLSNKSFSPAAAHVLMSKIKQSPNIAFADISDIIAGRPEEEALKTLAVFCDGLISYTLKEVNLSDNALGKKGIHACNGVLIGKSMEKLFLCNNGLSAEACVTVADILLNGGGCPPLKVLHFYNNMSGSDGAIAISKVVLIANLLQDFRFSATRSGNEGCEEIAKAIGSIDDLHRLDVSDNSFGESAAVILASSLSKQKNLKYLNLRDSGLTEDGTKEILQQLTEANIQLSFLDLSGNDLSSDCMESLVAYLGQTPTIEELYLDDNDIGNDGILELLAVLSKLSNLRILSLCFCELTAAAAYQITSAVSKLPTFHLLKLDGNQICARGVDEIKSLMIRSKKSLGDFDENDDEGEDDLEDVLEEISEDLDENDELSEAMSKVKIES